jgi:hypothetical protein
VGAARLGWAEARLHLLRCTKNTQEMPAGTLRKVGGSVPVRRAGVGWVEAVLAAEGPKAIAWALATAPWGTSHTRDV